MKAVKLKPVFFPNDDILIRPPEFIDFEDDCQIERQKNTTLSSTEQLKTILKGRQIKKKKYKNFNTTEDEENSVKRLSDWKGDAPKSPIKRKFTFRRGITSADPEHKSVRNYSVFCQAETVKPIDSFESAINNIILISKAKKKLLDSDTKNITKQNLEIENSIKTKINKLNKDIEQLKIFLDDRQQKLDAFQNDLEILQYSHESNLHSLSTQEAQELLFTEKSRKKNMKPGEESRYFIQKERLRHQKQEMHKKYQENQETLTNKIEETKNQLRYAKDKKQEAKKNLSSYRDEITTLYCRALKDGKDVRADGLRWIVKSLWKMNECVPLSSFPKFFDEDSCHFLLLMSEKDLQLESCSQKLEDLRKEIRSKRTKFSISSERELYQTVRSRLRSISQSSVGLETEGKTEENLAKNTEKSAESSYLEISKLKKQVSQLTDEIREMTISEIKRLNELKKGETDKIQVFHLIKCLVGEKIREFGKYARQNSKKKYKGLDRLK